MTNHYRVGAIFEVGDLGTWGRLRPRLAPRGGGPVNVTAWPYPPLKTPGWHVSIDGDLAEVDAAQAVARFLALGAVKVEIDRAHGGRL